MPISVENPAGKKADYEKEGRRKAYSGVGKRNTIRRDLKSSSCLSGQRAVFESKPVSFIEPCIARLFGHQTEHRAVWNARSISPMRP